MTNGATIPPVLDAGLINNDDAPPSELAIVTAALRVQDALEGRLSNGRAKLFLENASWFRQASFFIHIHWLWQWAPTLATVAHVALAMHGGHGCSSHTCALCEAACIAVYIVDILLKMYYMGCRSYMSKSQHKRLIGIVAVLSLDLVERACVGYHAFSVIGQMLRPAFFITRSRALRRFANDVIASATTVAQIMQLMLPMVLLFAAISVRLFRGTAAEAELGSIGAALQTLVVLMTDMDNYAEVAPIARSVSSLHGAFIVSFVVLGAFLLMNLLTPLIYNAYTQAHAKQAAKDRHKAQGGLKKAFTLLDSAGRGVVYYETFARLMRAISPDCTALRAHTIFDALVRSTAKADGRSSPNAKHALLTEAVREAQFVEHMSDVVEIRVRDVQPLLSPVFRSAAMAKIGRASVRIRAVLAPALRYASSITACVVVPFELEAVAIAPGGIGLHELLALTQLVEIVLLLLATATGSSSSSGATKAKGRVDARFRVGVLLVAALGSDPLARVVVGEAASGAMSRSMVRQLARVASATMDCVVRVPSARSVALTILRLLPVLLQLLSLQFVIVYAYAVLGVFAFGSVAGEEPAAQRLRASFSDVGTGLWSCFAMTAGNWSDLMADAQAVLGGAASLGGALALLFFFTFQYVAVVLQLNVITSVVADLFENEHASAGVHITEFDIVGEDGTPKSTVRVWMNDRAVGERSSVLNWDKVKIAAGLKRRLSTPRGDGGADLPHLRPGGKEEKLKGVRQQ